MHLIAQGSQPHQRWRKPLPEDTSIVLGRSVGNWAVPWDPHISGQHVDLKLQDQQLLLHQRANARNPIFVNGREVTNAVIQPGEHFVIGSTTFSLSKAQIDVTIDQPQPHREQQFSADYLRELRYRDAEKRIHVLSQLPEIIGEAPGDTALLLRLTGAIFLGIPLADTVAIVRLTQDETRVERNLEVLHWDRKTLSNEEFRPSRRLIESAVRQSVSTLHIWQDDQEDELAAQFTARDDHSWAFCTPVAGRACDGWAIYVAGSKTAVADDSWKDDETEYFRDDVKFTETVAVMLGNLLSLKSLERTQTTFRQFFSAPVLESLGDRDPEKALAPQLAELCVLFCDIRAFSSHSEKSAGDLLGLLDRVSSVIAIMTRCILDHGGVIGDFQGDSAMGFWGWPIAGESRCERACAAAFAIRREFEVMHDQPLSVGIGIASGRGVAGKIGTPDQVKVTVFGPVVNLAARLESMTRKIQVPILIDGKTARQLTPEQYAVRPIAEVVPFGLETRVEVLSIDEPGSVAEKLNHDIAAARKQMTEGNWKGAAEVLSQHANDPIAKFLLATIEDADGQPPNDWDGAIRFDSK